MAGDGNREGRGGTSRQGCGLRAFWIFQAGRSRNLDCAYRGQSSVVQGSGWQYLVDFTTRLACRRNQQCTMFIDYKPADHSSTGYSVPVRKRLGQTVSWVTIIF